MIREIRTNVMVLNTKKEAPRSWSAEAWGFFTVIFSDGTEVQGDIKNVKAILNETKGDAIEWVTKKANNALNAKVAEVLNEKLMGASQGEVRIG